MTVQQLIEELKKHSPELRVMVMKKNNKLKDINPFIAEVTYKDYQPILELNLL